MDLVGRICKLRLLLSSLGICRTQHLVSKSVFSQLCMVASSILCCLGLLSRMDRMVHMFRPFEQLHCSLVYMAGIEYINLAAKDQHLWCSLGILSRYHLASIFLSIGIDLDHIIIRMSSYCYHCFFLFLNI